MYGLKSAGQSFCAHLADCMYSLGYKSCLADPNLWYKFASQLVHKHGSDLYAVIDDEQFTVMDWKNFYSDVQEPNPPNA
ncbi:hypothetical protein ACHAXS_000419 [Conticribra weissflogii]